MNMTDSKAITATVVTVVTAILAVILTYAPDWMTQPQKDSVITLITVITPVVVALIAVLHHNTANVAKAEVYARNGVKPAPRG